MRASLDQTDLDLRSFDQRNVVHRLVLVVLLIHEFKI